MKTFKGTITSDFKIVVPDQFIANMRNDAKKEDAVFLKVADTSHPVNDEAFIEMILKNGMRQHLKATLLELYANSGLGGTVSPARVEIIGVQEDHDAPVGVQVITREKLIEQAPDSAVVTFPGGFTTEELG